MRRLLSRTMAVDDPRWTRLLSDCTRRAGLSSRVRLLRSRDQTMPLVGGALRPAIVIPAVADLWDDDRRRAVLLHEIAHVARLDCLTQTLAEIGAAIYWPHPGAWWLARRLRVESELACDDCVLTSGTEPRDYAGHLLEIAHSHGGDRAPALVLGMARPRQLEGRMLAILDATRVRTRADAGRWRLGLVATALIVAPLSAATIGVQPARGSAAPAAGVTATRQPGQPATPPGTWQIRLSADGRSAEVTVSPREHSFHSTSIALDRIDGLEALLKGPGGLVHRDFKRDAGVFTFDGMVRSGAGGGTFTFAPDPAFADQLVKRGFARPTPLEQEALAGTDIGFAFIDELAAQRYTRPSLAQIVNAAQHGITIAYIRELGGLGYHVGTVDTLIRLRDHGVSGEYVRDLRTLDLSGLTADDLVRARDHGVSREYLSEMRTLGYRSMTLDEAVAVRDHGAGPEYVRQIATAGYQEPTLAQLIQMRDHGITPQYIQEVQKHETHPSIDRLIWLHDRGLTQQPAPVDYRIERLRRSEGLMASIHMMLRDAWRRWTGE
jgi:hypothetical protein